MAKSKRKGKSKQKKPATKPVVAAQNNADATATTQTLEQPKETVVDPYEGLTEKQIAKLKAKEEKQKQKEQRKFEKEKAKKLKKEQDEKNGKVSLGRRIKETGSELKKVSWPSFKEVCKKTGVVIAVVLFFAVALVAFDWLLSLLYNLFIGGLGN